MNSLFKLSTIALILVFTFAWDQAIGQSEENDFTRFMNVKAWKGKINISIMGNMSYRQGSKKVNHQYSINFSSGEGEKALADPFLVNDDKEAGKSEPVADGDELIPGVNIGQVREALKNSGIDQSLINKQISEVKGMNIAFDKYKMWMAAAPFNIGSATLIADVNDRKTNLTIWSTEGCGGCCPVTTTETFRGFATSGTKMAMVVNTHKNVYSFKGSFAVADSEGKYVNHSTNYSPNFAQKCGMRFEDTREDLSSGLGRYSPKFEIKAIDLPASGMTLTGSEILEDFFTIYDPRDRVKKSFNLQVDWFMIPADHEMPQAEIYIDDEYKDWVPEKDNEIEVKVSWQNVTPSEVRFTVYDISGEPGICLNSEDRNTEPDLELSEKSRVDGYEISIGDNKFVATKLQPKAEKEVIYITSKDYGAHGKVMAEINVDGNWFRATVKGGTTQNLHIPWDENQNHIADKWEKDIGVFGKNYLPNRDEDENPKEQYGNGDGYTLYEEYRGFEVLGNLLFNGENVQIKDNHIRMDPDHKDIFVYDQHGVFKQFYAPYNPPHLNWHYIDPSLVKMIGGASNKDSRWVNFNTTEEYFYGRQYAMHVASQGVSSGTAGKVSGLDKTITMIDQKNLPEKGSCDWLKQPLKCIYLVNIYTGTIQKSVAGLKDKNTMQNLFNTVMTSTTIHEIGHGLGIHHHYDLENNYNSSTKTSVYKGILDCAMRYTSPTEYEHPGFIMDNYRYCRKNEKWKKYSSEPSGSGEKKPLEFDEINSHDCFGQIKVKTDPSGSDI